MYTNKKGEKYHKDTSVYKALETFFNGFNPMPLCEQMYFKFYQLLR